jgi:hypothetical protein
MKRLWMLTACVAMLPVALAAQTPAITRNSTVPPSANTTHPDAAFFVDLTGLNLATQPPTRDPRNPKYPAATELPDGVLPSKAATGNFIIGPTHNSANEITAQPGVPKGTVVTFTMTSADSVVYNPGVVRDEVTQNAAVYSSPTAPGDPSNVMITASHPGPWSRKVSVYVPQQLGNSKPAPFIVMGDGGSFDSFLFTTLDNLISQGRIPPMVAITVGNGGSDAPGSERGREYDTVSGAYSDFIENEVLPLAQEASHVALTSDPNGRATMGISSSAAAAFTMAWFHPERYHRVLGYSPTMTNQQWPHNPALPGGAWEYHSVWGGTTSSSSASITAGTPLILNSETKPIRYWFETGDQDLFYTIVSAADGMHDWTLANENMAKVLASKGYEYQFIFAKNAGHVDLATVKQTLPYAIEWLWADYPVTR